jgi:hypothetical protein
MQVMLQRVAGGRLHREIRDCPLVELGNAGAALPVERGPNHSGVEGMRGPVRGPAPIDAEELMMLRNHLYRFESRDAEAAGEGDWPSTVLHAQQTGLSSARARVSAGFSEDLPFGVRRPGPHFSNSASSRSRVSPCEMKTIVF